MIAGSMVALVTPMDAQGRLDWASLSKLVDFHLENGTHAIVAVGIVILAVALPTLTQPAAAAAPARPRTPARRRRDRGNIGRYL